MAPSPCPVHDGSSRPYSLQPSPEHALISKGMRDIENDVADDEVPKHITATPGRDHVDGRQARLASKRKEKDDKTPEKKREEDKEEEGEGKEKKKQKKKKQKKKKRQKKGRREEDQEQKKETEEEVIWALLGRTYLWRKKSVAPVGRDLVILVIHRHEGADIADDTVQTSLET